MYYRIDKILFQANTGGSGGFTCKALYDYQASEFVNFLNDLFPFSINIVIVSCLTREVKNFVHFKNNNLCEFTPLI